MSSGSESDEDYVPGEPEVVSEEDSANEETELQYEKELENKAKKRKAEQENINGKKSKSRKGVQLVTTEKEEEKEEVLEEKLDPEEEKKREEDLWAKFLDGTESKSTSTSKELTSKSVPLTKPIEKCDFNSKSQEKPKSNEDDKARETRIFEFAGETIIVENNVIKEKIRSDSPAAAKKTEIIASKSRGSGGLSGVLDQLNKKTKLSTLEKTKLDWETYKKEENVEEEIKNYNRGKHGYLDRQGFLERADLRQFEIERDLRQSRRSNRLS